MERSSSLSISDHDQQSEIEEEIEGVEESQGINIKQLSNSNANENQLSLRSPTLYEADKNDREKEEMAIRIS